MVAYSDKLDGMKARLATAQKNFKSTFTAKDKDPKNKRGMHASYTSAKSAIDSLKKRIAIEEAKRAEESAKSKKAKTPKEVAEGLLSVKRPTTKAEKAKTLPVPPAPAKKPKVTNRKAELAAAREAEKGFSAEQTKGFSDKKGMTDAEANFAAVVIGTGATGAAFRLLMKIGGMEKVYDWFTTSGKKPTVAAVKDKIEKVVPKNSHDKLPVKFRPKPPKKVEKPPQLRKPKEKPGTALVPANLKLPAKPGTSVVPKAQRPPQGAPQLKHGPVPGAAPKKLAPPPPPPPPPAPKRLRTGGGKNIPKAAIIPPMIPRGTEKEEVASPEAGPPIPYLTDIDAGVRPEKPEKIEKKEQISESAFGRMLGLRRSAREIERDVAITKALDAGNYDKVAELEKQYGKAPVKKSLTQRTKDYTPEQIEAMLHPDVKGSALETLKKLYAGIESSEDTSSDPVLADQDQYYKHGGRVKSKKKKKKSKPRKVSKVYVNQPRKPSRA